MRKYLFLLAYLSLGALGGFSQSVAINTDGSKPNPNAIVDVKSTTKGVLLPRMTSAQRHAIPNTKGLLVYDTDENLYWYNDGASWQSIYTTDLFKKNGVAWLLTGNSLTQDKSNFIGTKDNVPLNVRVNNQPSGRIDPSRNNTYFGYQAGKSDSAGINNTSMGAYSLFSSTLGNYNTAFGVQTLSSNTGGGNNTTMGYQSMLFNLTGNENTAVGAWSLFYNTKGSSNTAIGISSLLYNTEGYSNTGIGYESLLWNGTGYGNSAIGMHSLLYNTTGIFNTASGYDAMRYTTKGDNNTADGTAALLNNTTGSGLTALGAYADVTGGGFTNSTAVGYQAVVDASNKIRIGNQGITLIEGQVPFTTPSDGRFKFNIQENVRGLDFILKLRPVTYQFDVKKQEGFTRGTIKPGELNNYITSAGNDEATQMIRTGFIAQEVEQAAKKTGYNFDGVKAPKTEREYYSLSYSSFVVPLVKAMQEQQQIISSQNQRISNLEQELAEIKTLLQSKHN